MIAGTFMYQIFQSNVLIKISNRSFEFSILIKYGAPYIPINLLRRKSISTILKNCMIYQPTDRLTVSQKQRHTERDTPIYSHTQRYTHTETDRSTQNIFMNK